MIPNYRCPVCETPSEMIVTPYQAFCTNVDSCPVLVFNPSLPDGGLADAQWVDLSRLERGGAGGGQVDH